MKDSQEAFFDELKINMVMRAYGISRAKALEVVAARPNSTRQNSVLRGTCAGSANATCRKRGGAADDFIDINELFA